MLANLDVLIGTVVILLGVSLVVTIVNQSLSAGLALRGRNLRWGLTTLIQELHADRFTKPDKISLFARDLNPAAKQIVSHVLRFPLVSGSKTPVGWFTLASTIRFDEFIKTLLLQGSTTSAGADLKWLAENNRITETWFNSVMDRVSQRFVMHMRLYSVAVSLVVVVALHFDTLAVINRLRSDAALRQGLVSAATSLTQSESLATEQRAALDSFTKSISANVPDSQNLEALLWTEHPSLLGMLLSVVLLSLGAPFWFSVLKNLIALRSIVAKKEEQERTQATGSPDVGDRIRVRRF